MKSKIMHKILYTMGINLCGIGSLLASIAVDSPTNYTTATWTNGANMGSGFTPWEFINATPEPIPRSEIFNVDAENWAPEVSWNIMSTTNETSSASRGFKSLDIGDQIYTEFKIDAVSDLASRVGFRLYDNETLLYFVQYEDDNDRWNLNDFMFWTGKDLLLVTEFTWGRSADQEIDIFMKYDGVTRISVQGAISLGSAFLFFGFCFLKLASKVYDFFTGYGAAYDMNFLEYVLLISGTFLAGFASVACLFATLVILS